MYIQFLVNFNQSNIFFNKETYGNNLSHAMKVSWKRLLSHKFIFKYIFKKMLNLPHANCDKYLFLEIPLLF